MPRALDLTGQRFGYLTALYKVGNGGPGVIWHCACSCGNEIDVPAYRLTGKSRTSCGCNKTRSNRLNLVGKRFGNLVVVEDAGSIRDRSAWLCECDCGTRKVVTGTHLMSGNTISCGCVGLSRLVDEDGKGCSRTHAQSRTRLYKVWTGMIQRCTNPNHKSYKNYGGRGITVCDEWRKFEPFYEWATKSGYDPEAPQGKCTIDRIDVNGNYEPSNCRWADMKVQRRNQRPASDNQSSDSML